MLEIERIPFYNTFEKSFGHINAIVLMDKVDNFERIVLKIGVSLLEIGPYVGTQLRLEFHILFRIHDLRSQRKLNLLYVEVETVCVVRNE